MAWLPAGRFSVESRRHGGTGLLRSARRHDFMIFHREIAKNHSFTATESEIPPPNVRIIENERRRFPQFPSSIKNKKKQAHSPFSKGSTCLFFLS